jgi:hypothetical protein
MRQRKQDADALMAVSVAIAAWRRFPHAYAVFDRAAILARSAANAEPSS